MDNGSALQVISRRSKCNQPNNSERNLKMTTRGTALVVIVALSCVALSVNLHAQGDTGQQIKELQQQSRDAQMKTDSSQGIVGAIGKRRTTSLRICRTKTTSGKAATLVNCRSPHSVQTLRFHITHLPMTPSSGERIGREL